MGTHCVDIDECGRLNQFGVRENATDGCEHGCTNVRGESARACSDYFSKQVQNACCLAFDSVAQGASDICTVVYLHV